MHLVAKREGFGYLTDHHHLYLRFRGTQLGPATQGQAQLWFLRGDRPSVMLLLCSHYTLALHFTVCRDEMPTLCL